MGMQERKKAAELLRSEAGENLKWCPILLDTFDNEANRAYGALPERLYVVLDGIVVYMGQIGPFGYKIEELEKYLQDKKKI